MTTQIVRKVIKYFCNEFVSSPYLCYTEHGLHARFYCQMYNALPSQKRYLQWEGKKMCVIQKEYPTASPLGKSQRQHWDISIIQSPPSPSLGKTPSFDYLTLGSVIEFGLNADLEHLEDDINRLCHPDSNVNNKFIVHFYRLSNQVSKRDWNPKSQQLLNLQQISELVQDKEVEVYFAISDSTDRFESGAWMIYKNKIKRLES